MSDNDKSRRDVLELGIKAVAAMAGAAAVGAGTCEALGQQGLGRGARRGRVFGGLFNRRHHRHRSHGPSVPGRIEVSPSFSLGLSGNHKFDLDVNASALTPEELRVTSKFFLDFDRDALAEGELDTLRGIRATLPGMAASIVLISFCCDVIVLDENPLDLVPALKQQQAGAG